MRPARPPSEPDETLDPFFRGRFRLYQNRRGYRFSADAPLLADFVETRPGDEVLELGTGCGVVAVLLSLKPFARLTALEVQEDLAGLARRNVELNGLAGRIEVVRADLRAWEPGRRFDVVLSNPPYVRGRRGRLSDSEEKSVAKHEIMGDIFDIMRATRGFLAERGRACFVYPEKRRKDLEDAMNAQGLAVTRRRSVLPRDGAEPCLFLVECGPAPGVPVLLPPLVLHGPNGRYTAEAEAVFAGRATP